MPDAQRRKRTMRADATELLAARAISNVITSDPTLAAMVDELVNLARDDEPLRYRRLVETAVGYAYATGMRDSIKTPKGVGP
jgi:hypothetical protein